jgi:hypothetical protein
LPGAGDWGRWKGEVVRGPVLMAIMDSWVYASVKTYQILHFNMGGLLYKNYTSAKLFKKKEEEERPGTVAKT